MGELQQGMDVERVRSIAAEVAKLGDDVQAVAKQGRGQLATLSQAWEGPDTASFQSRWDNLEPSMDQLSEVLRTYSTALRRQADDQQQASAGEGGSGGPGGPGGPGGQGNGSGSGQGKGLIDRIKDIFSSGAKDALNSLKKGFQAAGGLWALQRYLRGTGTYLKDLKFLSKYLGKSEAVKALGRIGPMTLKEAKAAGLAGWTHKLGKFGGLIRGASGLLGKVAGPLGVISGGFDLYEGIKNGDWLTAVKGGAGIVSGAAVTALAFGGAALAGTAAAPFILGAAVVGGAVWAGIEIWQNREAIWNGMKAAGSWVGDRASDVYNGAKDVVSDVKDKAGSVIKGIGKGLGSVFG